MSDSKKQSTTQRRNALKKIIAGTGAAGVVASAPEKWSKPMVDAITLPAHATTSLPLSYSDTGITTGWAPNNGIQEFLIPTAQAGIFSLNGGSICVNFNADMETYSALVTQTIPDSDPNEFPGTGGVVGSPLQLDVECPDASPLFLTVESGPNISGIPYTLCNNNTTPDCISGTLPPGQCSTIPETLCDD